MKMISYKKGPKTPSSRLEVILHREACKTRAEERQGASKEKSERKKKGGIEKVKKKAW
ncbi:MAG: hypothetical protein RI601_07195 [Desulfurivibrionaceae bacterium]|nr:hypothetical protein [Desulfurivibrionaceae bacterium]